MHLGCKIILTVLMHFYKMRFMHFIKHRHKLKDEVHTHFSGQVLANQLVILSLFQFQILLTLSPFFLQLSC
jgi:hypothetical protein